MEIITDVLQGSIEWHKLREKRLTASHGQAIAANGAGLNTYVNSLMQKYYSTSEQEDYKSKAMARGNELEDSAIFAYEAESGLDVERIGFVIHNEFSGCSPDGFAEIDGLIEVKCLEDKAYFQFLLDGKIDTKYLWQMQMQMLICKKAWCAYTVYNPNFKASLVVKVVDADNAKFDKLLEGMAKGRERIIAIQKQFEGVL